VLSIIGFQMNKYTIQVMLEQALGSNDTLTQTLNRAVEYTWQITDELHSKHKKLVYAYEQIRRLEKELNSYKSDAQLDKDLQTIFKKEH